MKHGIIGFGRGDDQLRSFRAFFYQSGERRVPSVKRGRAATRRRKKKPGKLGDA